MGFRYLFLTNYGVPNEIENRQNHRRRRSDGNFRCRLCGNKRLLCQHRVLHQDAFLLLLSYR